MGQYSSQPTMMAIGDSMYQGVRAMSFEPSFGFVSTPKMIANAMGLTDFDTPDWPWGMLYNFENMLQHGALIHVLSELTPGIRNNVTQWLSGVAWSEKEAFENISVGGANISQLYQDSFSSHWQDVEKQLIDIDNGGPIAMGDLGALWYKLNCCATLNPKKRTEQAGKSQIDQVMDRAPQILLVNIGSNEGLFRAVFEGDLSDQSFDKVKDIPKKMADLADKLAALPSRVEKIVFNSLVRPRAAGNLWPRVDPDDYPGDDYFPTYVSRIMPGIDLLGARVKAYDDLIHDINRQTLQILQSKLGGRLVWIDLWELTAASDGKHYDDRAVDARLNGHDVKLRNIPLAANLTGGFKHGGLSSLDNMHPSVPGYALVANTVLEALGRPERVDINLAVASDPVLTHIPHALPIANLELSLLGLASLMK